MTAACYLALSLIRLCLLPSGIITLDEKVLGWWALPKLHYSLQGIEAGGVLTVTPLKHPAWPDYLYQWDYRVLVGLDDLIYMPIGWDRWWSKENHHE